MCIWGLEVQGGDRVDICLCMWEGRVCVGIFVGVCQGRMSVVW